MTLSPAAHYAEAEKALQAATDTSLDLLAAQIQGNEKRVQTIIQGLKMLLATAQVHATMALYEPEAQDKTDAAYLNDMQSEMQQRLFG